MQTTEKIVSGKCGDVKRCSNNNTITLPVHGGKKGEAGTLVSLRTNISEGKTNANGGKRCLGIVLVMAFLCLFAVLCTEWVLLSG